MEELQVKPKHAGGRPVEWTKERIQGLAERLRAYFNVAPTRTVIKTITLKDGRQIEEETEKAISLPTLQGFCNENDISKTYLLELIEEKTTEENGRQTCQNPELVNAYAYAKAQQEAIWQANSLNGGYNSQFAIFLGKNVFGWKDKTEVDQKITGSVSLVGLLSGAAKEEEKETDFILEHKEEEPSLLPAREQS